MGKKIDPIIEQQLKAKWKPMFKGLVLWFDNYILQLNIIPMAKLVYAGLYFSVPKAARYAAAIKREPVIFKKPKLELIKELGISRAQFYRAINVLEDINLITSHTEEYGRTYYKLYHEMELNYDEIKGMVTTEMLQRTFVRTQKRTNKTFSPNSKIILGLLAQKSRESYKREIKSSVNELNVLFNIPVSTLYHLIKQFSSCGAMTKDSKERAIFTLLLLDEYIEHQRKLNELTSGTHPKKRQHDEKTKVPPDDPFREWFNKK